jgi:hypothetical protein
MVMSAHAVKLALVTGKQETGRWDLEQLLSLKVSAMASRSLRSRMEAFALAAGISPCLWRTVADHTTATAQPEKRMKKGMLKDGFE